jgi:hypothetical protein
MCQVVNSKFLCSIDEFRMFIRLFLRKLGFIRLSFLIRREGMGLLMGGLDVITINV